MVMRRTEAQMMMVRESKSWFVLKFKLRMPHEALMRDASRVPGVKNARSDVESRAGPRIVPIVT